MNNNTWYDNRKLFVNCSSAKVRVCVCAPAIRVGCWHRIAEYGERMNTKLFCTNITIMMYICSIFIAWMRGTRTHTETDSKSWLMVGCADHIGLIPVPICRYGAHLTWFRHWNHKLNKWPIKEHARVHSAWSFPSMLKHDTLSSLGVITTTTSSPQLPAVLGRCKASDTCIHCIGNFFVTTSDVLFAKLKTINLF